MSPPQVYLPPALPNELIEEVLARFPPDDPALLVRTALVCKDWCRLISGPGFRRRFRQRHRTPPLLGYFHHHRGLPYFVSTSSFRFRPPYAARRRWRILNARHGRALVLHTVSSVASMEEELIVWDPITDKRHRLPMPPFNNWNWNAALLCAAAGCDHLDCPWGPFLVVFVCTQAWTEEGFMPSACIYSSEQGSWREPISIHHHACHGLWGRGPNVLIGNAIYFGCQIKSGILEYDLGKQEVSMIGLPPVCYMPYFVLMTEGGELGLGCINVQDSKLCLWSRVAGPSGYATWTLQRVIELDKVMPPLRGPSILPKVCIVVANADDVGVVFICVGKKLFTVDLKSNRAEKVGNVIFPFGIVPYMDFYTPALRTTFTGEGGRSRCLK